MSDTAYAKLMAACKIVKDNPKNKNITPAYYREHKIGTDHDRRFRWDMFWASMAKDGRHNTELYKEVSAGLNDEHIDTALRKVVKELYGE